MWASGLVRRLPRQSIDHAVVGAARGFGRNGWGAALLMRDVGPHLVPEGDDPVVPVTSTPRSSTTSPTCRPACGAGPTPSDCSTPRSAGRSSARGCWRARPSAAGPTRSRPSPTGAGAPSPTGPLPTSGPRSTRARRARPARRGAGRTRRGRSCTATGRWATSAATPTAARSCSTAPTPVPGPACHDLGWYLAMNRARLPESKEATIERFRGRSGRTASTRRAGGTASSTSACSGPSSSSGGRRRWATATSWPGGSTAAGRARRRL